MKTIKLSQGKQTSVDDCLFETLSSFSWCYHKGYAARVTYCNGKNKWIYLHRYIMSPSKQQVIDHIDGDTLNNTKVNLRICTNQQNSRNRRVRSSDSKTSTFKGVDFVKARGLWRARIMSENGKRLFLGMFESEKEAARKYNEAAREIDGTFFFLNLLGDSHES